MQPVLKTNRLLLREFSIEDAGHLYELNLDPEVIKYTGNKPFVSPEAARDFIINYDHYQQYGFGRWAVIKVDTNEFIGWCGLKYSDQNAEHDIGFRFFKKYWNHGFATEAALPCLELGVKKFKIQQIVGRAMKQNVASVRVLEKIGLKFWKEFDLEGATWLKYKMNGNDLIIVHDHYRNH
jgi:ribosomal-protein-alanine N-acetyltransferase